MYTGDFKEGKMHGLGAKVYPNKDKYEGAWEDDKRSGHGI